MRKLRAEDNVPWIECGSYVGYYVGFLHMLPYVVTPPVVPHGDIGPADLEWGGDWRMRFRYPWE